MSWIAAWRERISAWCSTDRRDRELREEIAHHLELETARRAALGVPLETARAQALDRFGHPDHVVEATRDERGGRFAEGTMHDLHRALRSLRGNSGFTALALLTLALGIGATCVAFTVFEGVLLRPLPFRDPERLVFITERTDKGDLRPPSHPNFVDWRERTRSFDGWISATFPSLRTVAATASGSQPVRVTTMGVSRGFFRTLGLRLASGREFTDDENAPGGAPVAMVSYEFWRAQMNGRSLLGSIRVGRQARTVVGVLPPDFTFVTPAQVYLPHEQEPSGCRTCSTSMVVARIRAGVTAGAAREEMSALSAALVATHGTGTSAASVDMQPLLDYLVKDSRALLAVVLGAAGILLLIACTNLLSAQLARGWVREREIAVQAALGASRRRLFQQLLIESGVLIAAGATVGLLLAAWTIRAIRSIDILPRLHEVALDARVVVFVLVTSALTMVLVGVYPAWRHSHSDPGRALSGSRGSKMTVRSRAWHLLIGAEVGMAVLLSIGSTLLVRTLHNIMNHDIGFSAAGLLTVAISPAGGAGTPRLDEVRGAFAALPAVEGVAFTTRLPLYSGEGSSRVRRPADPVDGDWPSMAGFRVITPDYFSVLRQPVVRGRPFNDTDRDGAPLAVIITPGLADKLWPGEDPLGKKITTSYLSKQWLTIVGVVAEASSWRRPRGTQNEIFVPFAQQPEAAAAQGGVVAMIRASGSIRRIVPLVRDALRRIMPEAPVTIHTMDDLVAGTAADRRFAMIAISAFAVVALVLAAVGIYGVVWYSVTTRSHEIGIRMALGATPGDVYTRVLAGGLLSTLAGVAVGVGMALFAGRFIESLLFGVSRADVGTYLTSAALVLGAVAAGAFVPARRATRVDPLIALRPDA